MPKSSEYSVKACSMSGVIPKVWGKLLYRKRNFGITSLFRNKNLLVCALCSVGGAKEAVARTFLNGAGVALPCRPV